MTDPEKLCALAEWHDVQDDKRGYTGEREVQHDLRVIALELELLREVEKAIKSLFNGSRKWMSDGDADQWEAFDFLAEAYAKQPVPLSSDSATTSEEPENAG